MQVSYRWLQDYVDIDINPEELAERLTMTGLCVDRVERPWAGISGIVAGKIVKLEKHPNADKLLVCQIDMGGKTIQVVTGAPNVAVGNIVPVAVVGAKLPKGEITKSELRGVESFGMLCSMSEMNIDSSAEAKAGIWLLPDSIKPGTDMVSELMLDDAVLEFDLTPNRSDCLSVINIAREVAAILGKKVKLPKISYSESKEDIADIFAIDVQNKELCPRYTAKLVQGVKVGESPLWMQHYLRSAGMRPINNVVDISNFVMLEWGQPLHTFDFDTLAGGKIVVRSVKPGEKIVTLDEEERELPQNTTLICDGEKAVCIAGIMGGMNTEITQATENILIESACFDMTAIRRASKALGLRSESSQRFEKGIDIFTTHIASERAVQLLVNLCNGVATKGMLDSWDGEGEPYVCIKLNSAKVNAVLGTSYDPAQIKNVFERLEFGVENQGEGWLIKVPSYRRDIFIEEDLIEEVARLLGYENIPTALPFGEITEGKISEEQAFYDKLVERCMALGLRQVINYGFIGPKAWDLLGLAESDALRKTITIKNPLNIEQSIMRTTLLPGMLATAARNNSRRNNDLAIFERGNVFIPGSEELPDEPMHLAVLLMGRETASWQNAGREYDFYYLKGILELLCKKAKVSNWYLSAADDISFLHPGQGAHIYVNYKKAGYIGQLNPLVGKNYELNGRAYILELDLDLLYTAKSSVFEFSPLAKFPPSTRDLALVAKNDIPAVKVEEEIKRQGGNYLKSLKLFDVYEGIQLEAEYRSLAYALTFQALDRTLTDEEVNAAMEAILTGLQDNLQVRLR